jgi:hypothetical protein
VLSGNLLVDDERKYGRWMREFCLWKDLARCWRPASETERDTLVHAVRTDPRTKPIWRMRDKIRTRQRNKAGKFKRYRADRKERERKRTLEMSEADLTARREKRRVRKAELREAKRRAAELERLGSERAA